MCVVHDFLLSIFGRSCNPEHFSFYECNSLCKASGFVRKPFRELACILMYIYQKGYSLEVETMPTETNLIPFRIFDTATTHAL